MHYINNHKFLQEIRDMDVTTHGYACFIGNNAYVASGQKIQTSITMEDIKEWVKKIGMDGVLKVGELQHALKCMQGRKSVPVPKEFVDALGSYCYKHPLTCMSLAWAHGKKIISNGVKAYTLGTEEEKVNLLNNHVEMIRNFCKAYPNKCQSIFDHVVEKFCKASDTTVVDNEHIPDDAMPVNVETDPCANPFSTACEKSRNI